MVIVYDVQMAKQSFNEDLESEIFAAIGDGSFADILDENTQKGSSGRSTRAGVIAAIHGRNVLVEFGPREQGCCPKSHFEVLPQVGESLEFTIQGAKVSDLTGAGQPERTLLINAKAILGEEINELLLKKVSLEGDEMVIQDTGQNRSFEKRLSRAANRAGLPGISAYSLRHQFSADLKDEVEPDQVSLALGHVSRKSRKRYGHAKQRRSGAGGLLVSVQADRELRGAASRYALGANTPAFKYDELDLGFE